MSLTRSLTRPLTRKISRADLTQGFGGSFSPFALDPYLLFDARDSMVGTLENPTLDLNPALPETLDVITATRAGIATYTDPDGNIATASADTVRVDYTQGDELTPTKFQNIGHTDFANSYWTARGFTKVGVVDGPLGYTGYEFAENNTNPNPGILPYTTLSDGSPKTFSVWLKASSPVSIALATTGSVKTSTINVTTEWQFFQCTDSTNGGSGPHIGGFATITQGSGITLFAAMPQFEEGTTATTFVENTTGNPKFTGISATYAARVPMILVEPSSENLITRSEDFSFSGWTKNGASVANGISSPDGNNTAFKLTEDATGSGHYLQETVTVSSATIYTASIFVKYESREWIRFTDAESINRVHFNTRTGQFGTVVGTVIAYSSTELDDGWHRITITSTSAGTAYSMRIILAESDNDVAYTGDGTSGIYVWGAQLETGSVATSLIPTSGGDAAARTRAADDLVITGSAFSSFFNGTEGTIYAEFVPKRNDDYRHVYEFSNGGTGQRINLHLHDVKANFYSQSNGATYQYSNNPAAGATTGVLHRSAFSYKTNDAPYSFDGGAEIPDTEYSVPSGINRLYLGDYTPRDGNYILNGHIKRLIYWPYHSDSL